jgi:hypothetical protein
MPLSLPRIYCLLWALFLPTLAAMAIIDAGLKGPHTPAGIISFELCDLTSSCGAIIEQWGPAGERLAMLSLGLDYLYLMLYPALICIGLLLLAPKLPEALDRPTRTIAWLALLATPFDGGENFFLIMAIVHDALLPYTHYAALCSVSKFAVFGLSFSWLLLMLPIALLYRPQTSR